MLRVMGRLNPMVNHNLSYKSTVSLPSKYRGIFSHGRHGLHHNLCGVRNGALLKDSINLNHQFTTRNLFLLHRNFSSLSGGSISVLNNLEILNPCVKKVHSRPMSSENKKDEDEKKEDEENGNEDKRKRDLRYLALFSMATSGILIMSLLRTGNEQISSSEDTFVTSWSTFYKNMLVSGEVEKLVVNQEQDRVYVYLHRGANINNRYITTTGPHFVFSISDINNLEEKLAQAQQELGIDPAHFIPVQYRRKTDVDDVFNALIGLAIFGAILFYCSRVFGKLFTRLTKDSPFQATKSKATIIEPGSLDGIRFKDVAGMEEAKQEVMEFIDYLKDASRFTFLGAKIPKGALLVGPPGTGKTLLAKAVATEAEVPFFSVAGTDFVEMYGGVGPARVRDLFAQARKRSPCIVYVDEIDAIGKSRSSSNMGGNMERENTLNQLLVEMDGMNTVEGVVMIASTNREDVLDQALLRPGRFDRRIEISLPTLIERQEIFEVYLNKLKLWKPASTYSKRLAELTPGHSGASISNVCNEAALHAARLNEGHVDAKNFDYAIERVIAGIEKKSHSMSPEERKMIAYHEAGHVLVGWMLEHTEALLKVSIAPHTNSVFGFALHLPTGQHLITLEQAMDRMSMALGGRAAEAQVFSKITTGSTDDLKKITRMARKLIVECGMSPRVGNISFPVPEDGERSKRIYSNSLQQVIDEEVNLIIGKSLQRSTSIIKDNQGKLHKLAKELLEKEVLSYENIEAILGSCPWGTNGS